MIEKSMAPSSHRRGPGEASAAADAAHAADVSLIQAREQEEQFARQHSMPTRLLGWMLIAGTVLQLIGGLTCSKTELGGFLFLLAGIQILKGSQGWLRMVIFFCVPGALLSLATLIWDLAHQHPIEINKKWYDFTDLKFWTLGVSPLAYIAAEGILGVLALRTRRLRFWTQATRICAVIFGTVILISWVTTARDWMRSQDLQHAFPAEIAVARAHVASSTGKVFFDRNRYTKFPQIETIECHRSGNSISMMYNRRHDAGNWLPQQAGERRTYTEWCRDGSGKFGKLEIEFIVPENP